MFRSVRGLAAVVLVLGLAVSCGSSGSPSGGGTGAAATPTATMPAASRIAALKRALLAQADVGHGLSPGSYSVDTSTGPCGKQTMQAKYPKHVQFGTYLEAGTGVADFVEVDEDVVLFATEAAAEAAYMFSVAELSCRRGALTEDGRTVPVAVSAPRNVVDQVGGGHAMSWRVVVGEEGSADLIAVHLKDMVLELSVANGSKAAAGIPDPIGVAKVAVGKLSAA